MASQTPTTKTIAAHCHCKAVNFTFTFPTSILPLEAYMCHCSICRYILGAFCCFHSQIPRGISPDFISPSSPANLTTYNWPGNKDDWLFCSTCGCHIGTTNPRKDADDQSEEICWTISTSSFPKDEGVFKLLENSFTYSAPGGGLHGWVTAVGDRQLGIWNPEGDVPETVKSSSDEKHLLAQCHCKGVTICLPRPPSASTPFVSPVDSNKWIAMVCVCDSCRLTTGAHATTWTYVPLGLVEVGDGDGNWSTLETEDGVAKGDNMGLDLGGRSTVKVFESSPGVRRSFCGTCGATIMYGHVSRGDVVAVSMGIVRAPDVRAEDWVTWKGGVVGALEDGKAYDREFAEGLAGGLKKWSLEKYGEAYEFATG